MRRTLFTFLSAIALVATGVVGAIAVGGTGTVDPPPKIAFLANGIVPADALAAGGIAGQLGAPLFTTPATSLNDDAKDGIVAYAPDLVIALGGPVAINDSVLTALSAATGLPIVATTAPDDGIVRVAGGDRFATARAVAGLLAAYDPAYLPVDATALGAIDADQVDGMDADEFALSDQACDPGEVVTGVAADGTPTCAPDDVDGGDADTLDGLDADSLVRVAGDFDPDGQTGATASLYEGNLVTIEAPVDGWLHITSSTQLENNQTSTADNFQSNAEAMLYELVVDGVVVTNDGNTDCRVLAGTWTRCAHTIVVPVTAGSHDVNVLVNFLVSGTLVTDSSLSVLFTPFGFDGSQPDTPRSAAVERSAPRSASSVD